MRRRTIASVLLVLILGFSVNAPKVSAMDEAVSRVKWQTIGDEYAVIHYGAGKEEDATKTLAWLREARQVVFGVLGEMPDGKVTVYLFPDHASWLHSEGNMLADTGGSRKIWALTWSELTVERFRETYPRILTHELTHIVMGQMRPSEESTPEWLNEGLAEYTSTWGSGRDEWAAMVSDYDVALQKAASSGELNLFSVGSPYERGSQVVRFLFETYGKEKMQQLIRTNSGDMQADIQSTLGITWTELRSEWLQWVHRKFSVPMETILGEPKERTLPISATKYTETPVPIAYPQPVPALKPVVISLQLGNPVFRIGDIERTATVAPRVVDGRTVVPLRVVAEALGAEVSWDPDSGRVTLTVAPVSPSDPGWQGTGEGGQYLHVSEEEIARDSEGIPCVYVSARGSGTLDLEDVAPTLDGRKAAFVQYRAWMQQEPDGSQTALVVAAVRMVQAQEGGWRSVFPIIIRKRPGVTVTVDDDWFFSAEP